MVGDMKACLLVLILAATSVWAEDELLSTEGVSEPADLQMPSDVDRDPAAVQLPAKKRNYPGGADEESLVVQAALPEAAIKTDARSLQRDVYKQLFNQELKEERQDEAEE